MRELKFRVWKPRQKSMFYPKETIDIIQLPQVMLDNGTDILMEYMNKKDKDGKEIYEGDIIVYRSVSRKTLATNDNGLVTYEPEEPIIKTEILEVVFEHCAFCFRNEINILTPLFTVMKYDERQLLNDIVGCWDRYDFDLQADVEYLMKEHNLNSKDELIDYLGVSVIGNIYENQELLTNGI